MPRLPAEPPDFVREMLEVPFVAKGRDASGVDCWGGVRLVYLRERGVVLPAAIAELERDQVSPLVDEIRDSGDWRRVDRPGLLDVGLFRARSTGYHVGLAVAGGPTVLHWEEGSGALVEPLDGPSSLERRLIGWYRYEGRVNVRPIVAPLGVSDAPLAPPAGLSVSEILERVTGLSDPPDVVVRLNGRDVPRGTWGHVRPRAGTTVEIYLAAAGGGGKNPLRLILTIIVLVAAIVTFNFVAGTTLVSATTGATIAEFGLGLGSVAGAVAASAVFVGGTFLVNAIAPPPSPQSGGVSAGPTFGQSPSLSGGRNSFRPYAPVPVICGVHRIIPVLAARPYTELVGRDQFLRMLFVLGHGPINIADIRIGSTPITEFAQNLEYRHGRPGQAPLTLFPGVVVEEALSLALDESAGWLQRTSDEDADELSVDFVFPAGLVEFFDDGSFATYTVDLEVEYRPVGSMDWIGVGSDDEAVDLATLANFFLAPPQTIIALGTDVGASVDAFAWTTLSAGPGDYIGGTAAPFTPATNRAVEIRANWNLKQAVLRDAHGSPAWTVRFAIDGHGPFELYIDDALVASRYQIDDPAGTGGQADFEISPSAAATNQSDEITFTRYRENVPIRVRTWIGDDETDASIKVGVRFTSDVGGGSWEVINHDDIRLEHGETFLIGTDPPPKFDLYQTVPETDPPSDLSITAASSETVRRSLTWQVPTDQYEVRCRRTTPDTQSALIQDDCVWSVLRTIKHQTPVNLDGLALLAMRIKATDQLQGVIDTLSVRAAALIEDWDDVEEVWTERVSGNPASLIRHVLARSPANANPIAISKVDEDGLADLAPKMRALGLGFHFPIEDRRTIFELVNTIARAGRASFQIADGLFSAVMDEVRSTPVQHFTPRNSRGFRGRRVFADIPHGLRCRFVNAEQDYQRDERIVLDDGYQYDGVDAFGNPGGVLPEATEFEAVDLEGIVYPGAVWRVGRYQLAVMRLRPEIFELEVDFENLIAQRGDLILVTHDVPVVGLASGRIHQAVQSGSTLEKILLDGVVVMESGKTYDVRVRKSDGSSVKHAVDTVVGEVTELIFSTPLPAPSSDWPEAGDLYMFGETDEETGEFIVTQVLHDTDLSAKLTLTAHAPAVHSADTGTIPDFDSGISDPPGYADAPSPPTIDSIRSDYTVLTVNDDGSVTPRIAVFLRISFGDGLTPTHAEVKYRRKAGAGEIPADWTTLADLPIDAGQISLAPVVVGQTYEIRVRVRTADYTFSTFTDADHEVVGWNLPPAGVASFDFFELGDSTRRATWDLGTRPPNVLDVELRFGDVAGTLWEDLIPITTGLLRTSPFDTDDPPAGTYVFAVKAVDLQGNRSLNDTRVSRTLGASPSGDALYVQNARLDEWDGAISGAFRNSENCLEVNDANTWDSLTTWDDWSRWNLSPGTSFTYTSTTLDTGSVQTLRLSTYADVIEGSKLVELRYSSDGVAWSAWVEASTIELQPVTARYVETRITVSGDGTKVLLLCQLATLARAE